jgi:hypothetical protein
MKLSIVAILGVLVSSTALSQTYHVASATVTHTAGWPSIAVDTRSGVPLSNGYVYTVNSGGGQIAGAGLQANTNYGKVDGNYWISTNLTAFGLADREEDERLYRDNIAISFKVICVNSTQPPGPGSPNFALRCRAYAEVSPVSGPLYNEARAAGFYISPTGTVVEDWIATALFPGGDEIADSGFIVHKDVAGTHNGWTQVSRNMWETTVVLDYPTLNEDQDLETFNDVYCPFSGSIAAAWSHSEAEYQIRLTDLGSVHLQDNY